MDCCILALRLLDWLCFCNKNIGFNSLKAPLRQCSTSTCCTFSFTFLHSDCVPRSRPQNLLFAVRSRQWSEVTRRTKHSSCAHHARTIISSHFLASVCLHYAPRYSMIDRKFKIFYRIRLLPYLAGLDCWSLLCRGIHKSPSRIINKQLHYLNGTYDAFVIGKASDAKGFALSHNFSCIFSTWHRGWPIMNLVRLLRLA